MKTLITDQYLKNVAVGDILIVGKKRYIITAIPSDTTMEVERYRPVVLQLIFFIIGVALGFIAYQLFDRGIL